MDDELPHVLTSTEPLRIDTEEGTDYLYTVAAENNAGLIVIDPLYAATGGYSLSEANLARRSLTHLKDFCSKFGVTALVLHHLYNFGKQDRAVCRVAESAQLSATASMQMLLTIVQESRVTSPGSAGILPAPGARASSPQRNAGLCAGPSEQTIPPTSAEQTAGATRRLIKLSCRGRGNSINRDWLFSSDGPLDYRQTDFQPDVPQCQAPTRRQQVIAAIQGGASTVSQIVEQTGFNAGSTRNLMLQMIASGEVYVLKIDSGVRHFRTPRPR